VNLSSGWTLKIIILQPHFTSARSLTPALLVSLVPSIDSSSQLHPSIPSLKNAKSRQSWILQQKEVCHACQIMQRSISNLAKKNKAIFPVQIAGSNEKLWLQPFQHLMLYLSFLHFSVEPVRSWQI
jgi:hypothetical protein